MRVLSNSGIVLRLSSLLFFIMCWQFAAFLLQSDLLPSPWMVTTNLVEQIKSGELVHHMAITLRRVFISFFIALLIGFIFGLIMGSWRKLDMMLDGLVTLALNIPALVTIILCFIWFGLTEFAAILAVIINKVPIVIVTIREGVKSIDQDLLRVAKVYQIPKWRTFKRVFMPQMYPYLLASIRTGLSLIWKIVLVVELLGCSNGVGFQLGIFFQYFEITSLLAYTIAFVLVMLLIELILVQPWERKINLWRSV